MTPEQKAAYVFAQAVCAMAEIEGMKADNAMVALRDGYPMYVLDDFNRVIEKYGIHHNAVIGTYQAD